MKKHDIKIGQRYRLVSLKDAEEIDDDYRKYGYGTSTGLIEHESGVWGSKETVTITNYGEGSENGKFKALFPSGEEWWVVAEWLLPEVPEVKKPKSTIRLIRG